MKRIINRILLTYLPLAVLVVLSFVWYITYGVKIPVTIKHATAK